MFHPMPPAPCIAYGFAAIQTIDVIYAAIAKALPDAVPAQNGGDICSLILWGRRVDSGESWVEGTSHPIGQGGSVKGDGSTVQHIAQSATRLPPTEVSEAKRPWIIDRMALAQDSCGAGTFRGGLGIDLHFRVTEDLYITTSLDRTKNSPMGLAGGAPARPNAVGIRFPDGRFVSMPRKTRFLVPKGSVIELSTGGGAGFGPPANRSIDAVRKDLEAGYISQEFAALHYPHAF
jgi:N-methylhydantoinase B